MKNDLTVIILNYNGSEDTVGCLKSIDRQVTEYSFRTVVLDNDSRAEEYEKLYRFCKDRGDFSICDLNDLDIYSEKNKFLVRSPENYGFARGNNEICKRFINESLFFLLLNNDTEVEPDFLQTMLTFLKEEPTVKYASCRINYYFDKSMLWNCGGYLTPWGNRHAYTEKELAPKGRVIETPYITGCALFLEAENFKKQGMLTEDFFFGEEDFNFSWRMKQKGVRGACLNKTLVYHKVSQSSNRSGLLVGKMAGYYLNRIIDMHGFYGPFTWTVWKELLKLFVMYSCRRKGMSFKDIKAVINTINMFEHQTKLTKEDCFAMRQF